MSEETETQPVNNDPYREVAIRIVKIVLDNQTSLPPPGVESSRPEAWKEVAGILRTHTAALQRRVEWTRDAPDKPGHYWMREAFQPTNDHVEFIDRVVEVFWYGDRLYCSYGYIARLNNEWAGPLEPPHEARG